jgi:hypothetical protein
VVCGQLAVLGLMRVALATADAYGTTRRWVSWNGRTDALHDREPSRAAGVLRATECSHDFLNAGGFRPGCVARLLCKRRDARRVPRYRWRRVRLPGLYSWWCDPDGAAIVTVGLGHTVEPGLIYAGLAGATRSRSGRRSTNTIWGRVRGMHLGGRHEFSTFRLSLGSILANACGEAEIDEDRLTAWMYEHLRLMPVPVDDVEALDGLETAVLAALNPPLNLDKMPRSPTREKLTELRRPHGRKPRPR